jgi:hypothetical protein
MTCMQCDDSRAEAGDDDVGSGVCGGCDCDCICFCDGGNLITLGDNKLTAIESLQQTMAASHRTLHHHHKHRTHRLPSLSRQ